MLMFGDDPSGSPPLHRSSVRLVMKENRAVKMGEASNPQRNFLTVPLYEYRCKNCGHQFEKIQSFSAPEEKECPVCQGPVERLISASAVQFKGSGWYATDYASKSKRSEMKASADGESKSAETKSDTKPVEKSGTSSSSDSGSAASSTSPSSPAPKSE
jgi:putative FmdB family regulatory protein